MEDKNNNDYLFEPMFKMTTDEQGNLFALFVRQPFASMLADGRKTIEIRSQPTDIRGDILICSTKSHDYPNAQGGCTIGIVELYDIKKTEELTDEEWEQTRTRKFDRRQLNKGYAWFFKNPRRVIEYPVMQPKNKIAYIKFNEDDLFVYPKIVKFDKPVGKKRLDEFFGSIGYNNPKG